MIKTLRQDVEALARPGTRKVGTTGHQEAQHYLISRMDSLGLHPYQEDGFDLPYTVGSNNYTNLAGVLPGTNSELAPLLLVAHYDTCGDQPGADDNAAAISICLALIKRLKSIPRERDLLFLFPDAEEPPRFLSDHMGSSNFYKHQRVGEIHAGIVLDLVGHDVPMEGMEDLIFIFGAESHEDFAHALLTTPLPKGLRNIATLNRYVGDLSDHHILRKNNKPYLFLTCGRWTHYHQESDRPENLNYEKMERIVIYLFALVQQLLYLELKPEGMDHDSLEMEIELMKRAIGPVLEEENIPMNSREDIQHFVLNWVRQFEL